MQGLTDPGSLPDVDACCPLQMVVVMDPEDDGKPKIPQARRTADFMPPARERRYVFDKAFDAHLDNRALSLSRCVHAVVTCALHEPAASGRVVQSKCIGTVYMLIEVMRQRHCR